MKAPSEKIFRVRTDAGEFGVAAKVRNTADDWVVFLHGWGCVKESFDAAFEIEQLGNYSMCSMDFLGFGNSDKPHNFSYDLAEHARVVTEVVRTLEAKSIYLVGHSMGGAVGLVATSEIGEMLHKFINIEGILQTTDSRMTRKLASEGYAIFRDELFLQAKQALRTSARPTDRQWSEWFDSADTWAAYQSARSTIQWADGGQLLPKFLGLPNKAYVFGENSERVPYILPKLQDIETRKIVHSGHFPMIDNPSDFYTGLTELIIESDK